MYSILTTHGFIINSRPYGEAGKILSIFTRDLGLITTVAQGIRLEKSKLKAFTQNYSFGTFSFVKGKEFRRLTGADTLGKSCWPNKKLMAKLAAILHRLLHGEESHKELFENILACALFSSNNLELNKERMLTLESLTVIRILHCLGYVGNDENLKGSVGSNEISIVLLDDLAGRRVEINRHINKALRESHL